MNSRRSHDSSSSGKRKPGERAFTDTERVAVLAEVEKLDRLEYTQHQIADRLGIGQVTVHKYLLKIRQMYVERMVKDREEHVAKKLEEYRYLRREAWEAYERSKQDMEREHTEHNLRLQPNGDDGEEEKGNKDRKSRKQKRSQQKLELILTKRVKTRQGRIPAVEYLRLIKETYDAERQMLGLDEAVKLDVRAQVIDWGVFHVPALQGDIIDQRINDELNRTEAQLLMSGKEDDKENHEGSQRRNGH